jgi:hypothetical protein
MAALGFQPIEYNFEDEYDVFANEYIMYAYLYEMPPDINQFIAYYNKKTGIVLFDDKTYTPSNIFHNFHIILKTARYRLQKRLYNDVYNNSITEEILAIVDSEIDKIKQFIE